MSENIRELLNAHEGLKREVYLDIENSSMVLEEVVEEMLPYFNQLAYGNPTLTHKPGWEAFEIIMKSIKSIAHSLGCGTPEQINITPGETEANNLALLGLASSMKDQGRKIVISETAPLNILHTTELLVRYGFTVVKIPVNSYGFIDLEKLEDAIDRETALVSLSAVNHEVGTIEPLKESVETVKDRNPRSIFHAEASDAYGKIPLDVKSLDVDMATISSYKILGPRGIGALYVKEGVNVERIIEGQIGTQRLWPGVENTPLIVGFAKASELAIQNFEENIQHMRSLRDRLINGITEEVADIKLNGPKGDKRAPDNVNLSFLRCEGEALTIELSLNGVYVSSGSACSRRLLQPSHVLVALGRSFAEAHGSILMKVAISHVEEDIEYVLEVIPKAVERIRGITGSMELN
ncbi:aminotransferase class V-fold PLP-dependent enzyme [Candidatus Bathyarchaeota archaeon]|nr:aminotransferase class V-fold PLP-dependent enzyme [Candidatus Bathyarchaeota archaeon]